MTEMRPVQSIAELVRPGNDVPRKPGKRWPGAVVLAGAGAVAVILVALVLLRPAERQVDRRSVIIAEVQRGPMVLSIRGSGKLVPERLQFVTALTSGRVEQVLVMPGEKVQPDRVLVRLINPDVDLQSLQAQEQLSAAMARLADSRRTLETARVTQSVQAYAADVEEANARRDANFDAHLNRKQFVSDEQSRRSAERAAVAAHRLEAEAKLLAVLEGAAKSQYWALDEQVRGLREIVRAHRLRQESLVIRAGAAGTVEELSLQPGQWVQSGTVLARIVGPEGLKAQLRVPQSQAGDVRVGQEARLDLRMQVIPGRVRHVDPNVRDGSVLLDVELRSALPAGVHSDLSVDGTIILAELKNTLRVARPAAAVPGTMVGLFRLDESGSSGVRTAVSVGRASVNEIEISAGLSAGDRVIVSDMSEWDRVDRIRLR
jgi:HlyD family secretion protein